MTGNHLVSQTDVNGDKHYYFHNAHGDVIAVADASGRVEKRYEYNAYGESYETGVDLRNPRKYFGQYYDEETGEYYLRARYYSPVSMRFVSEDTYSGVSGDPLSLNRYLYVSGNPVRYVDVCGYWPEWAQFTFDYLKDVDWEEVVLGTVQAVGGVFEVVSGVTVAAAGTTTVVGTVAAVSVGTYLAVDGISNVTGGLSRAFNALRMNDEGETANFMKDLYIALNEEHGEEIYNVSQLIIAVYSLSTGVSQLKAESAETAGNIAGLARLEQGTETWSYITWEGNIFTKSVYTTSGLFVKSTQIDISKLVTGVAKSTLILDAISIYSIFDDEESELENEKEGL